jgi:DNA polymerase III epsilon subunit family exonuclease
MVGAAADILDRPIGLTPVVFFDVETTGSSPGMGERIIEFGVVRVLGGRVVDEWSTLVNPCVRLRPGITALTGITDGMLADQPTAAQVLPEVLRRLSGAVLCGHNVRFDLAFLRAELGWNGMEADASLTSSWILDTLALARRAFGRGGNGLQHLAKTLQLAPAPAHRALGDALTTFRLLERLVPEPADTPLANLVTSQGSVIPFSSDPIVPDRLRQPLRDSVDARQALWIEYIDRGPSRMSRIVRPTRLHMNHRVPVLVAECPERQRTRTFRLDRMLRCSVHGADSQM